jgi:hypothetical protein
VSQPTLRSQLLRPRLAYTEPLAPGVVVLRDADVDGVAAGAGGQGEAKAVEVPAPSAEH